LDRHGRKGAARGRSRRIDSAITTRASAGGERSEHGGARGHGCSSACRNPGGGDSRSAGIHGRLDRTASRARRSTGRVGADGIDRCGDGHALP